MLFCLLPLQALSSHQDLDNAARSNKILVLCGRGVGARERRGENESGEWFCIDTIGRHFIWAVNIDSSVPSAGRLGGAGAGVNCIASTLSASGRSHSDRDGNEIFFTIYLENATFTYNKNLLRHYAKQEFKHC